MIVICCNCDEEFEESLDPDCIIEFGNSTETWCQYCREFLDDDNQWRWETENAERADAERRDNSSEALHKR